MESLGERLAMFEAKVNYSMQHTKDFDVTDSHVRESSAGVFGWSDAKIEKWSDACPFIQEFMEFSFAIDDDLHGESSNSTKSNDPP